MGEFHVVDSELAEVSKLFSSFDPAGITIPDLAASVFDSVDRALQKSYPKAHKKHIGVARKAFKKLQSLSLWRAEFCRAVRESRYHLDDAQEGHDSVRSNVQAKLGPKFVANVAESGTGSYSRMKSNNSFSVRNCDMAERSKHVRRLVEEAQGDFEQLRATALKLAKEVVTQAFSVQPLPLSATERAWLATVTKKVEVIKSEIDAEIKRRARYSAVLDRILQTGHDRREAAVASAERKKHSATKAAESERHTVPKFATMKEWLAVYRKNEEKAAEKGGV